MDDNSNQTAASLAPQPPGADEDWSGRTVGEFQILRSIGRGGMGQVYLAEQTSLKRKVAIKMLRPELAANRTSVQRFRSEAEAVARINHANIVQIYAVSEQDGVPYMALEYVEGRNLRDYLNRKGPPELPACVSIMRQVASALQRAHEAGFIHRDVKPENILVTRKGEAKVTDFGLSRCFAETGQPMNLTQSGVAMGTPLYMSPEQVHGKSVDVRSDIYSYGVTCFALLAGTPPFRGASAFEVAVQHVQNEPPALASIRPDLPPELTAMVHKMMAKSPDDRYQSFKDVLRDLNKVRETLAGAATELPMALPAAATTPLPGGTVPAGFDSAATEAMPAPPTNWLPRIAIAAALLGVLAGGATVRVIRHRLSAKESPANPAPDKPQPVISSEERFLVEAARQFPDPNTGDTRELKKGLDFQIDLAVYYFKHHRLDDADAFFRELLERKYKPTSPKEAEHPYRAFARLGQALVLAFRDDPKALDQLGEMIKLQPPRPPFGSLNALMIAGLPGNMFDNPDLRRLIVDALNRIALNMKVEKFDRYPQLDTIRKSNQPIRPSRPKT